MSLGGFFGKQFIDVIDWVDEPGILAQRYPMRDREIQNGAKLTVREAQAAAFLNEGKMADIFGPGLYTLKTQTLPILTSLANWDKAFASPFKSDVYFFSLREQVDRKWGVAQPITVRDKELGAIRIRAYGRYAFSVSDVSTFWRALVGNLDRFTSEDIEPQLRSAVLTALATLLGRGDASFIDLALHQTKLSDELTNTAAPEFERLGLKLNRLFIESLSVPEEVQAHMDAAASVRAVGDLDAYQRLQTADSIKIAAANEGGLAGVGATAAAGLAIGQAMAQNAAAPKTANAPAGDPFELIEKLHRLMQAGAITQEEFDAKKAALLAQIG
jgi:membrane protease subunit (stomatin/prohibitin family)